MTTTRQTTTLRDRIEQTLATCKKRIFRNAEIARMAQEWQPLRRCELHDCPMFFNFEKRARGVPRDECYTCNWCEKDRRASALPPVVLSNRPDYQAGSLAREVHKIHLQRLCQDIVPSPPLLLPPPKNITPSNVRATLFGDVPDVAMLWPEEEDDATARRVVVRKHDTARIPAMDAEVALLELMRGPTHEQSTGENEQVKEAMQA